MPIVKKVLDNFQKEYGKEAGLARYFAWENANKDKYKKSLSTARRHGDKILAHAPKKGGK